MKSLFRWGFFLLASIFLFIFFSLIWNIIVDFCGHGSSACYPSELGTTLTETLLGTIWYMSWFTVGSYGIIPLYILLTLILFALLFRFVTQLFIPTRTTRIEKISFFINFIAIYVSIFFLLPIYIEDVKQENLRKEQYNNEVLSYLKEISDFLDSPSREDLKTCYITGVDVVAGPVQTYDKKGKIVYLNNEKVLIVFNLYYIGRSQELNPGTFMLYPEQLGFNYIDLFEKKFGGKIDDVFVQPGLTKMRLISFQNFKPYTEALEALCFIPNFRSHAPWTIGFTKDDSTAIIYSVKKDGKEILFSEYLKGHFLCEEREKLSNSDDFCR